MLQRLIRYLTALFSAYSFYANPLRYIVALLGITLLPYLLYLFFGTIVTIVILCHYGIRTLAKTEKNFS